MSDGSHVSSFLGYNRLHMLVCAKMISSVVRKVVSIARAHMSLSGCCSLCCLGSWCFLCVHPAGGWLGQSFFPSKGFFPCASLLWVSIRIQYKMLSWATVSSQCVGKCQTLAYMKSYRYVGLLGHRSLQYWANAYPNVGAVLALDSWNYFPGEPGPTAQHF